MAGSSEQDILREYLISLGFKVNAAAEQRFGTRLSTLDKRATLLGKSLVGVAVAAQTMATEFAFRMERLYYSSKLAESAAGNLQAVDFAGKQSGVQNMVANVENLARALRSNPGLQGLLNSLGVKVEGRDKSDVLLDMVGALKKMPFYIAERYANLFGISADDLLLMEQGLDKMREAAELRKSIAAGLGIDTEKAAQAGLEYAQQWREILMYVGLFRDAISLEMLPAMKELAAVTKNVLTDWVSIVRMPRDQFVKDMKVGLGLEDAHPEPVKLSDDAKKRLGGYGSDEVPTWTTKYFNGDGSSWDLKMGDKLNQFFKWRADRGRKARGEAPVDEKAVDAATAPDQMQMTRERKLQQDPKLAAEYQAAINKGDYKQAGELVKRIDALPEPKEGPQGAQAGPGVPGAPAAPETAPQGPLQKMPAIPDQEQKKHPREQEFLRAEETRTGLMPGTLDYVWKTESARGHAMRSPAGAKGHFGFMDATAKQYGVKDVDDFTQAAHGAADMLADLNKKYAGDLRMALAAYNWGQGNVDKLLMDTMEKHGNWSQDQVDQYVLGHMPEETRKYVAGAMAGDNSGPQTVTIEANANINVHEAHSARATAEEIKAAQAAVYSDVVRQMGPKIQ